MPKFWICGGPQLQHFNNSSWVTQDVSAAPGYPNCQLIALTGYDESNLFCCGHDKSTPISVTANPVFLYTTDGGTTWASESTVADIPQNTGYVFYDMFAVSPTEVYIIGHEFYSTQDYYLWKWSGPGTGFTQLNPSIIDQHAVSLWGTAGDDLYMTAPGNPILEDYNKWDGAAITVHNITGVTEGGKVRGANSDTVFILDNVNPLVLATGSHDAGFAVETLISNFYSTLDGVTGLPPHVLAVNPNGDVFVPAMDTVSAKMKVGVKKGGSWDYTELTTMFGDQRTICVSEEEAACVVYQESYGVITAYIFDGTAWSIETTGLTTSQNNITGSWGLGVVSSAPPSPSSTLISGLYVIAKDKIRILFSTEVSESHELLKESTYSLYNSNRGTNNVIKEVMPLPDKATDYIDLRISNITWGESYTFSIGDDLVADIDGLLIPSQEVSFIAHRTKVDNILKHMPDLYDVKKGNIRTILEAIGLSDNDIGGSTTEESTEAGESIGSGTYGTSTYGTDTYGG
jgi:hypothetical protein